jgi:site-specific DNA-methyltransferase (adenine-specific)
MKLIQGDCLEEMKKIKTGSVDMVLADPPYGTTACKWDSIIPLEPMWEQLKRVIKPNGAIVMTASQPFTTTLISSNMKMFKYCWYWEKERLTNIAQVKKRAGKTVEEVCVFYSNQPTYSPIMTKHTGAKRSNKVKDGKLGKLTDNGTKKVKEYKDNGLRYPTQILKFKRDVLKCNLHPTQKPVALMEYLIRTYTNEGETVLDFAMGSGTTGVAAKNLNRDFIGIELDESYYNIAKERIESA